MPKRIKGESTIAVSKREFFPAQFEIFIKSDIIALRLWVQTAKVSIAEIFFDF